jgi:hypothetical protein
MPALTVISNQHRVFPGLRSFQKKDFGRPHAIDPQSVTPRSKSVVGTALSAHGGEDEAKLAHSMISVIMRTHLSTPLINRARTQNYHFPMSK